MKTRVSKPRGLTLIELLIVIAILSIFSVGILAVATAPLRERLYAEQDLGREAGLALLHSKLTADAHNAFEAQAVANPPGFALRSHDRSTVVYYLDDKRTIRRWRIGGGGVDAFQSRHATNPRHGTPLLQGVDGFDVTLREDGRWALSLRGEEQVLDNNYRLDEELTLLAGLAWTGGDS